ncbi:hypothetical protein [Roseinatronobacter thiooxidans]|uniref:hypothetical protein n=1 Tax=Roseinatronobacter thiooxidans TaxID=121821 RepID=UPI0014731ED9|nr:hypothetical protein [Roseinatronobacter thiooxidans]
MIRRALTEAHWAIIEPFCLGKKIDPSQTIGRSRGGITTKILALTDSFAAWRDDPAAFS